MHDQLSHSDGWNCARDWPDVLFWREAEDGKTELCFVKERRNSASLKPEVMLVLRVLEKAGLSVRVDYAGHILTLEEFLSGKQVGLFKSKDDLARGTIYKYRHDLKLMYEELEKLPTDNPKRNELIQRITLKEQLLGVEKRPDAKPAQGQATTTLVSQSAGSQTTSETAVERVRNKAWAGELGSSALRKEAAFRKLEPTSEALDKAYKADLEEQQHDELQTSDQDTAGSSVGQTSNITEEGAK